MLSEIMKRGIWRINASLHDQIYPEKKLKIPGSSLGSCPLANPYYYHVFAHKTPDKLPGGSVDSHSLEQLSPCPVREGFCGREA